MTSLAAPQQPLSIDFNDDVYKYAIGKFIGYNNCDYHYLDSAATTQKPASVIEAISHGYRNFCAPVHRASYPHGELATQAYEAARTTVAQFINANPALLIFTKSCTESINQIAVGWAQSKIKPYHQIWLSRMEHNANYLPWYRLCKSVGAELKIIEIDAQGHLLLDEEEIWSDNTLLIALTHCSNVLGGENPIRQVCAKARANDICVVIDAAQSVSHLEVDVAAIDCDFLAFSAHKMYGPEGIGALYVKTNRMPELSPMLMGGGIIESVDETDMVLRDPPYCFEAGSPNLSAALGFAAAVEFIQSCNAAAISHYVGALGRQFRQVLSSQAGVTLLPVAGGGEQSSVISFVVDGVHPHDVAHMAAEQGVAIRTGNHCSHLLLSGLNLGAVNRISLGVYNSTDDIKPLVEAISMAKKVFL